MSSSQGRRIVTLVAAVAAGATLSPPATAATADGGRSPQTLSILAKGVTFTLNTTRIRAGRVTIRMRNGDTDAYQSAQVARLPDGVTREQFLAALHSGNPLNAYDLLSFQGGPNTTSPGDVQTTMDVLVPGHYVVLSFIPDSNGVVKDLEGMISWFDVVGPARGERPLREDGVFASYDYGYLVPKVVKRHGIYRYVNSSTNDQHELGFIRLFPGKTFADFKAWVMSNYRTTPPGVPEGGVSSISPGARSWAVVNMPPGDYVAACWVYDASKGVKHAVDGEMAPFTVI